MTSLSASLSGAEMSTPSIRAPVHPDRGMTSMPVSVEAVVVGSVVVKARNSHQ
ncbi:hypothetical protein Q9Q75_21370 [Mycobacterium intracellulare]|uniref:Uncharacterized protein n=1 Tax=Mycobacterium intracellulare TaxID=1767 RepID=A0AAE4UFN1_MYCIT|nr:hypothetical protein [Mycobacterium intracellulare]MDV6979760.1 hypothetical protein [Mycobacterium intracellulare]MDV6985348.1 hypothetical protein [Mycobacterium intracellulare]MDV7015569.1 hypothetical protein [Mycobacterium intracellulare]MDV7030352.1 hypothetical protein [Mycobacterium intracellulare]